MEMNVKSDLLSGVTILSADRGVNTIRRCLKLTTNSLFDIALVLRLLFGCIRTLVC